MKNKLRCAGLCLVLGAIFNQQVYAVEQELPKQEKKSIRKVTKLEDIKVTAQKDGERNLQDVPISITVISSDDIDDLGVDNLREAGQYVPNLLLFQHGVSGIITPTIRGVYAPATSLTTSAGLYIDGIPVLSSLGFDEDIYDIERIEVLRGPQGTLYGTGAESGAINIVTKQPGEEIHGQFTTRIGEDDRRSIGVNLNGPIVNRKLYFNISGSYYEKNGFITDTSTNNIIDDVQYWTGNAKLIWMPTDKLKASVLVSSKREDSGASKRRLGDNGQAMWGVSYMGDREVDVNEYTEKTTPESDLQALNIQYKATENITLTSVTSHWLYKDYAKSDMDGSTAFLFHANKRDEHDRLSQECRLNYDFHNGSNILVGAYFDRVENDMNIEFTSIIPQRKNHLVSRVDGYTYAAFINYHTPIMEDFNLDVGARYEYKKMEFESGSTALEDNESWDTISPKFSLEYNLTANHHPYITVSKGYRAGGYNWSTNNIYRGKAYEPEKLWSYEAGVKSSLFDEKVKINADLFYMSIENMQVTEGVSPALGYTSNAAKATSKGIEIEGKALVTDSITITAGYGATISKFEDFRDSLGNYEGHYTPFSPKYNFIIGGQYRSYSGFYFALDLKGYGDMYFNKNNQYKRDSFEIVNSKIGWELDSLDIYLYGKNIFDKEYNSENYSNGYWDIYSEPREIGVQLAYRF